MRSKLAMFLAVALAAAALGVAAGRLIRLVPNPSSPAHATLAPQLASYLGAFEPGSPPGYAALAGFGQMAVNITSLDFMRAGLRGRSPGPPWPG